MNNREKFNIIAERIKETGSKTESYGGNEWFEFSGNYQILYKEARNKRYIWLLFQTVVLSNGDYKDSWSEYYYPDDFNFEEFSDSAWEFKDLFEDLIDN